MAIGKVNRISSITSSAPVSEVTSSSKTLQNQILMKQQNLNKLSTDSRLSMDEKEKKRQELQKEIEELKRKLELIQMKQEETEKAKEAKQEKELQLEEASKKEEKSDSPDASVQSQDEKSNELSPADVQKMLNKNLYLQDALIQQSVDYDKENSIQILSSEIKQDELHGTDTSFKEKQLKEIREKENFWVKTKNKTEEEQVTAFHSEVQVMIEK